ncbi:MAG: hypothetical protein KF819_25400 [Labilithrix sp.]|nr:hypothetical protein [Labilithrix sp.]
MLVVKKYPNRRLYDTAESRYITLEDLADRIKAGSDVLVQDATTGADLTQATLTQIILESRGGARLLPVPLLLRLIRLGDEALAEFLGRYVSWALEMYVHARQGARALMPMNPLATAPFAATDALARLVLGATQWGNAGQPMPPPPMASTTMPSPAMPQPAAPPPMPVVEAPPSEPPPAPPQELRPDVADDVARLRREIQALKESLSPPSRAKKKPAKSTRKKR